MWGPGGFIPSGLGVPSLSWGVNHLKERKKGVKE